MISSGGNASIEFGTYNGNTSASQNADSLPTGQLVLNGGNASGTVTITNKYTGVYSAAFTCPTGNTSDRLQLAITATVGGVTATGFVWGDVYDVPTATRYSGVGNIVGNISGNITGNLSGSVGNVTGNVTVAINNDKTGYSLANYSIGNATFGNNTTVNASVTSWFGNATNPNPGNWSTVQITGNQTLGNLTGAVDSAATQTMQASIAAIMSAANIMPDGSAHVASYEGGSNLSRSKLWQKYLQALAGNATPIYLMAEFNVWPTSPQVQWGGDSLLLSVAFDEGNATIPQTFYRLTNQDATLTVPYVGGNFAAGVKPTSGGVRDPSMVYDASTGLWWLAFTDGSQSGNNTSVYIYRGTQPQNLIDAQTLSAPTGSLGIASWFIDPNGLHLLVVDQANQIPYIWDMSGGVFGSPYVPTLASGWNLQIVHNGGIVYDPVSQFWFLFDELGETIYYSSDSAASAWTLAPSGVAVGVLGETSAPFVLGDGKTLRWYSSQQNNAGSTGTNDPTVGYIDFQDGWGVDLINGTSPSTTAWALTSPLNFESLFGHWPVVTAIGNQAAISGVCLAFLAGAPVANGNQPSIVFPAQSGYMALQNVGGDQATQLAGTQQAGQAAGNAAQQSQWANAAAVNQGGGTVLLGGDQATQLAQAASGGAPSGPYTIALHFQNQFGNATTGTTYVVSGWSARLNADGNGNSSVSLPLGNFTISAIDGAAVFAPTAFTVDGDGNLTIVGNATIMPSPVGNNTVIGCLYTYDGQGNIQGNVTINFTLTGTPNPEWGFSDNTGSYPATSDSSGLLTRQFRLGCTYTGQRGNGPGVQITPQDSGDGTFKIYDIPGKP